RTTEHVQTRNRMLTSASREYCVLRRLTVGLEELQLNHVRVAVGQSVTGVEQGHDLLVFAQSSRENNPKPLFQRLSDLLPKAGDHGGFYLSVGTSPGFSVTLMYCRTLSSAARAAEGHCTPKNRERPRLQRLVRRYLARSASIASSRWPLTFCD